MTDGLNPIKHVYGEEPTGPSPVRGTPEYAEFEALRTMKETLDELPNPLPSQHLTDKVKDAALDESLLPLRLAYGEEAAPLVADDSRMAEYELLRTSKSALEMLPLVRPDASVLDTVKAAAAAQVFAPLQAAYGEGEAPEADSAQYAEYALLSSTKAALDQLPAARPDSSVVAAVLAAAKSGAPAMWVASDRPARSASTIRRWTPALAMAASLVVVAVTGLWVAQIFPTGQNANDPELVADAQLSAADQAAAPAQPEVEFEEAPAGGLFSPFAGSGQPTVSQDRLGGYVASRTPVAAPTERRAFANQLPGPPAGGRGADLIAGGEAILADAVVDLSEADTNKPAATVSEWDAGEDVRVLSLRLNQLARSSEGLSWDEPPTPLGASGPEADAPAEGIRSVRADNPPARVDVQMRSSEQRDDQ